MENNQPYVVVSEISMVETTVKKSRFIGVTFPVENIDQVKEALGSLKKSNKDAKHIAYAYLLGADFSIARNNDDGEPAGSAGAPIYQAIREKKVTNVLVAVVRYFGGVELGKSRLTRTYYSAALNAILNARKNKMVYCSIFDMKVTYSDYAILGKVLAEKGFPILEKNFDESMPMVKCAIPVENAEKAIEEIRIKIKDSAQMIKVDSMYYRFPYNG
ncbi:MAG: YigZ family protein [Clostridia bacterium]|nr:YigZ family protein [Clostridia bacterium]